MADRVSAAITIGGTIAASEFAGLAQRLDISGLSTEWGGPPFDPIEPRDEGPLALFAHDVSGGEFFDLEFFCVDVGLPFARWSGACPGAFAAERVVFTGAGEPRSFTADEEDHILIARDIVEALGSYAAVLAYFDEADFVIPPLIIEG